MDPVADMLVAIKNGYMANKPDVSVPYSKFKFEIAKTLQKEKFVDDVKKEESKISIRLVYTDKKAAIKQIKRVSKLGLRVYTKSKKLKSIRGGRGITIITTPEGVMTAKEAKSKKLGGEVICHVW